MSRRRDVTAATASLPRGLPPVVTAAHLPPIATASEDSRVFASLMVISAVGLGTAIQIRDGLIQPWAVLVLAIAVVACVAAFFLPAFPSFEARGDKPLVLVLVAALALEFVQLLSAELPGSWHGVETNWRFRFGLVCAAVLVGALVAMPRHSRLIFRLLIGTFLLLGIWIIRNVPEPYMDVWMVQTQTVKAFYKHGVNPYAAVYLDVYNRPHLYAPGAIVDGLVHQGFPYPPVAFVMALAGQALLGDYRCANLLAIAGAALLIANARPTRVARLAAALFLFTPRVFFVLESGWTEPQSALLMAAAVYFACRALKPTIGTLGADAASRDVTTNNVRLLTRDEMSRTNAWMATAALLGLFVASKQYLIFAAPLAVLLLGRRPNWRSAIRPVVIAVGAAAIVSLPLVLWNYPAFVKSTAAVAGAMDFRTDSLNFISAAAYAFDEAPSGAFAGYCGMTAAVVGVFIALRRGPRSPAGYCAAVALVYYLFFAFYKFAFCNYYYLIVACCCCAVGATWAATEDTLSETVRVASLD